MAKAPKLTLPSETLDVTLIAGKSKAITNAATAKNTEYVIAVDQLRTIEGFNVRIRETQDYRQHVESLKQSIREHGFYPNKPLAGYIGKDGEDDVIYLTDGHTRLEAVLEINEEDVDGTQEIAGLPVVLKAPETSIHDLTIALVQDNNGRPLLPYEMGIVMRRLQNAKDGDGNALFSKTDIARKLGITERYIDDLNLLVAAPKKVRDAVLAGKVAATLAIQELRKNPKKAEERITGAVTKAEASGKAKATKKDIPDSVKMAKHSIRVSLATGDSIKDVLKSLASQLREVIGHDDADVLLTDGTISVTVEVPATAAPEPAPEPKKGRKPAKVPETAPAAPEPAEEGTDGFKPAVEEEEGDPVRLPPAVPTVGGDDDPDDI